MSKWFSDLLGDEHGRVDEMVLLSIFSVLTFIGLAIYAVVLHHQVWEPVPYGQGLGYVLSAAMVGMGLKKRLGA